MEPSIKVQVSDLEYRIPPVQNSDEKTYTQQDMDRILRVNTYCLEKIQALKQEITVLIAKNEMLESSMTQEIKSMSNEIKKQSLDIESASFWSKMPHMMTGGMSIAAATVIIFVYNFIKGEK